MAEQIRRITGDDFHDISTLFDFKKSIEELKWLFTDPENSNRFNAFVAVNDDNSIIGVIGYIVSIYKQGEKEVYGVFPVSWKILSGYKGFAGVMLFKKALKQGDFGMAIGGSKTARALYTIFKYSYLTERHKLFKIFSLRKYFLALEEPFTKRILKTLVLIPGYFRKINTKSVYEDISFVKYDKNSFVGEIYSEKVFHKSITNNYIEWLLQFPLAETYAFVVKLGKKTMGVCVFYILEVNKSRRGRIVYMPYLGNDIKLWQSVVNKSFDFFKNENCAYVTAVSTNRISLFGLSSGMFKFFKSQPIYIKDTKHKLEDINVNDWYMQYSEGDRFYMDL